MIKDKYIALYPSGFDPVPEGAISVDHYFNMIKNGYWKDKVDAYRSGAILKNSLPMVTPSGLFSRRRADLIIGRHTGIIVLDLDAKDNKYILIEDIKNDLSFDEYILAFHDSVSGKGLAIYVVLGNLLSQSDYQHVRRYFEEQYDIVLDNSTGDISRGRYVSFDDNIYINYNYHVFNIPKPEPKVQRRHTYIPNNEYVNDTYSKVKNIIQESIDSGADITSEYNTWIAVGLAINNEFGESGRGLFHLISSNYSNYSYDETDKKYTSLSSSDRGQFKIGLIFYLLKR